MPHFRTPNWHPSVILIRSVAILLALVVVAACGQPPKPQPEATVGSTGQAKATTAAGATTRPAATAPPAKTKASVTFPESIAYVRNQTEIHLIQPDGTNDHVIFKAPSVGNVQMTVGPLAFRPDSKELAFVSDMEETTSLYQYDIFGLSPDGSVRRISNPPDTSQLASLSKGAVDVTVANVDDSSDEVFVVYVAGASQMQSVTVPPGTSQTVHFPDVALFPGHLQFATAIAGDARWIGAPDGPFKAGNSNHASVQIRAGSPLDGFGALFPVWRADGSNVADVVGKSCIGEVWPASAEPGTATTQLIKHAASMCAMDRGRTEAQMNQILYYDAVAFAYSDGFGAILQVPEGSENAGTPIFDPGPNGQVGDLRYLPDGSGFLFAYRPNLTDTSMNVYRFDFASKDVTQLTHLVDAYVVGLSIAPDGKSVVFEVSKVEPLSPPDSSPPDDLWKMQSDGQGAALFVTNGQMPDWSRSASSGH